jgi:hypothetical protein
MSRTTKHPADVALVKRCREHDEDAWRELFDERCKMLAHYVAKLLGSRGLDESLVNDIVSRVTELLVRHPRVLDKFDPERAPLAGYLAHLARRQIERVRKSEARQQFGARVPLQDAHVAIADALASLQIALADFIISLSPAQKKFLLEYLLRPPEERTCVYTQRQIYNFTHRIRRKLEERLHEIREGKEF